MWFFISPTRERSAQGDLLWSVFVRRPSINNCLKDHFLWNYQSKFNESFRGWPLQKYNKESWLINNNNEMANFMFCFKKTSLKLPVQIQWNFTGSFPG